MVLVAMSTLVALMTFGPKSTRGLPTACALRSVGRPCMSSCQVPSSLDPRRRPRARVRSLRSSSSPSSDENELEGPRSLDRHLFRLRAMGKITAEEAQSIHNARVPPAPSREDAIGAYLSAKRRRAESGADPIRDPGVYVRSIARTRPPDVEAIPRTPPAVEAGTTLLPSFLRKHGIGANEINENCLSALRECSSDVADRALQAYAKQKQTRDTRGTPKISDPSAYVLAVLR